MRRSPKNSGFVLLLALLVLVLAGAVLASAARRSCQEILLAGESQQGLQLKWGMVSIQAAVLPAAEYVIQSGRASDETPAVLARRRVRLGDLEFHLVIGDEQAKANVNTLARRIGQMGLAASLNDLQADRRNALAVQLRPTRADGSPSSVLAREYSSLDQVLAYRHPSELVDLDAPEESPSARITCWGSGRLNFKRAELVVMQEVLAGLLTATQLYDLDQFRRKERDCTLQEAIRHLKLSREQVALVGSALTDCSYCHSLWLVAEGRSRRWYRLYVCQEDDAGANPRQQAFAW